MFFGGVFSNTAVEAAARHLRLAAPGRILLQQILSSSLSSVIFRAAGREKFIFVDLLSEKISIPSACVGLLSGDNGDNRDCLGAWRGGGARLWADGGQRGNIDGGDNLRDNIPFYIIYLQPH